MLQQSFRYLLEKRKLMTDEAAIVMLAYVIIASIFVFFGVITLAFVMIKAMLNNINRFLKMVVILYEEEKQKNEKIDGGGFGS